jgi:hypothetical protein
MQGLFGARSALTPRARRSDTGVTSRRTVVSGGGWGREASHSWITSSLAPCACEFNSRSPEKAASCARDGATSLHGSLIVSVQHGL